MNNSILIELHFLPCIDYFISLLHADTIVLDNTESFQKQTFRNRTYLCGANNVILFTVPVQHTAPLPSSILEIRIDHTQNWRNILLRTIRSSYGKSAYFEHFYPYLEALIHKKHIFLWDLNYELLTICLKLLDVNKEIHLRSDINPDSHNKDLRNCINPKKNPYNKDIIAGLAYNQTFGKEFVNNLSIVDLLFCEGMNSLFLLKEASNSRFIKQLNK